MSGKYWPHDLIKQEFIKLCQQAREANTQIVLEIMPWTNISDLATAVEIIKDTAQPNAGLLLDIWHLVRGNIAFDSLLCIPPHYIKHVELCDALAPTSNNLIEDTINYRKLCGEGQFDITGFLYVLKQLDYKGPYGVEIISIEQRALGLARAAQLSFDTALAQFKNQ